MKTQWMSSRAYYKVIRFNMNKISCLVRIKMANLIKTFNSSLFQTISKAEIIMLVDYSIKRNLMQTQNKLIAKKDRLRTIKV